VPEAIGSKASTLLNKRDKSRIKTRPQYPTPNIRLFVRKRRTADKKQGEIGDVAEEETKKLTVQRNGGRQQKWMVSREFRCHQAGERSI